MTKELKLISTKTYDLFVKGDVVVIESAKVLVVCGLPSSSVSAIISDVEGVL